MTNLAIYAHSIMDFDINYIWPTNFIVILGCIAIITNILNCFIHLGRVRETRISPVLQECQVSSDTTGHSRDI